MRKTNKRRFSVSANRRVRAAKRVSNRRSIKASVDLSNPYIRIYLTNLGKYNEGELIGEWVNLPVASFDDVLRKIGIDGKYYDEYFITDFDTNIPGLHIGEYDNINELNELAERVKDLDEGQLLIVGARLDKGESFEDALDHCDDGTIYYDCMTDEDLGYQLVDMFGGTENLDKDTLEMYFDYDGYGRDAKINGDFVEIEYGTWVELY